MKAMCADIHDSQTDAAMAEVFASPDLLFVIANYLEDRDAAMLLTSCKTLTIYVARKWLEKRRSMYSVCLYIIQEELSQVRSREECIAMNDTRKMLMKKLDLAEYFRDEWSWAVGDNKPVLLLGPPSTHGGNKNANTTDLTYRTKAYLSFYTNDSDNLILYNIYT
eukprot:7376325-Prymnesium_polylepis.2